MAKPSFSGHGHDECENKIFQRIDVAGEVTITPKVDCGPVSVKCLEGRIISGDHSASKSIKHVGKRKCKVLFVQELLVEVPLEFEVKADCNLIGIRCGTPSLDLSTCLPNHDSDFDSGDSAGESSGTGSDWADDSSGSSDSPAESGESGSDR